MNIFENSIEISLIYLVLFRNLAEYFTVFTFSCQLIVFQNYVNMGNQVQIHCNVTYLKKENRFKGIIIKMTLHYACIVL